LHRDRRPLRAARSARRAHPHRGRVGRSGRRRDRRARARARALSRDAAMTVDAADHVAAAELATAAGGRPLGAPAGRAAGAAPQALGDGPSRDFLMAELQSRFPGDGILSEEGADDQARLARARVWIVDPLDGTREFSEPPRTDWAVHVALVVAETVVAGAVA